MEILIAIAVVLLCIWIGLHIIVGFFNFVEWFFASFFRAFIAFGFVVMAFFWAVVTFNQPHGHSAQQQAAYEPATTSVANTGSGDARDLPEVRDYIATYGEVAVHGCFDREKARNGTDDDFRACVRKLQPL